MIKSCDNCRHRYPNYKDYEEGPCNKFGEEFFNGEDWEDFEIINGRCQFWAMS